MSLVSQPALRQQIGNAVQKRLNSFGGILRGILVRMICHGQGLWGLGWSPARRLARYERTAQSAMNGTDKRRFPPHKRKE